MITARAQTHVRFGLFEADSHAGELRRGGIQVKLHEKPFQLLLALLERPGDLVTRNELQKRLWADGTFVEFENGLNNAISRLRDALRDSADNPRFIETVPRRGYRFIAPVEHMETARVEPVAATKSWRLLLAVAAIAAVALTVMFVFLSPHPVDSVAVLPFVTSAGEEGSLDEYVAFGMTEALIAELSRVAGIDVISQTSVLRYRNSGKPLGEIARELGVGTIVEGSVVREGNQVRTTVQLIDARSDTHRWTRTFRHDASTALASQSALARSIAHEIRIRLTGETEATLAGRVADPRAEEAYLKGRYFLQRGDEQAWARARDYFEQALAADSRHARAHAGLADFYILTDSMPQDAAYPRARSHALRALELQNDLADAHTSLAYLYHYFEWDAAAAEREFRRAIELDHNHSRARRWYGRFLGHMGRHSEAEEQIERAIRLDPLSTAVRDTAAMEWFHSRQFDRVIDAAETIQELNPLDVRAYEHLTVAYLFTGRSEEALAAARRGLALMPESPLFTLYVAIVQGRAGRTREAVAMLRRAEAMRDATHVPTVFLALAWAQLDRPEEAFRWLQEATRSRDPYMMILKTSPWFDPLRSDGRFDDVLRQVGLQR